ncbi:alpha/beta hydrolase [Muricauda sp. SCSIO 64092]|uniref:alpha/beta fold hydrolase n=1 Tax=Allomuricauda sp. SCSIO 64092 TaxID=2908842 RepID=UPI001FF215C9|nr:alpha/beta hydrolase [Muricauda sp. SCSIO 64092]UOY05361.1 alpha/beta hydrolase [Muricauda sp. SCSIO 64092]
MLKKWFVRIASILFPNRVVAFAYHQLTSPQIRKLRPHELVVLDQAEQETFRFQDFDIQLYTWLGGDNRILPIHGWEGQAGNFTDLIQALRQYDYTIYAFDAPSHGFSSKGKTSLFEFAELVGVLIKKFEVAKLVSHSFGGVATTYALFKNPDIRIETYVLFTVPNRFLERINDVAQQVGITENVKNRLVARLEMELQSSVAELNVSDFVSQIQVEKALILHDKNDAVIPIERSKKVKEQWKNARFMELTGTGHFRILRTPEALDRAIQFINGV